MLITSPHHHVPQHLPELTVQFFVLLPTVTILLSVSVLPPL